MVFTSAVLLLLSAGLFTVTDGLGDDCKSYFTSDNVYMHSSSCWFGTHCCGDCDLRYCCPFEYLRLSDYDQTVCTIERNISIAIGLSVAGVVVFIVFFICCCCCCPCCCFYQMCRKPRPAVQTHVTTVMNTQSIQMQPVMQVVQPQQYQPVPTQPGNGGQPMQTAPYQGQSYAPEPPPSYDMATGQFPASFSQAAYDEDQTMYALQAPLQPALPTDYTSPQQLYNPDYIDSPETS